VTFDLLPHLDELEDGEGRSAVVSEPEADYAQELSVEAAVTQTQQEAAEQGHAHTGGGRERMTFSWNTRLNMKNKQMEAETCEGSVFQGATLSVTPGTWG